MISARQHVPNLHLCGPLRLSMKTSISCTGTSGRAQDGASFLTIMHEIHAVNAQKPGLTYLRNRFHHSGLDWYAQSFRSRLTSSTTGP
ncbi:hypothetical protein [Devosia sp. DBB001]|nr:hypothetical protein [Devosia sp. DBB001]